MHFVLDGLEIIAQVCLEQLGQPSTSEMPEGFRARPKTSRPELKTFVATH